MAHRDLGQGEAAPCWALFWVKQCTQGSGAEWDKVNSVGAMALEALLEKNKATHFTGMGYRVQDPLNSTLVNKHIRLVWSLTQGSVARSLYSGPQADMPSYVHGTFHTGSLKTRYYQILRR